MAKTEVEFQKNTQKARQDLNQNDRQTDWPFDCDVLSKWEEMFDKYMKVNGFEKKTKDHYELHMNYQRPYPRCRCW